MSTHFALTELLPCAPDGFANYAREVMLSELFAWAVLEPLRARHGPISINTAYRHACGWRTPEQAHAVGSTLGSDHTVLTANLEAHGAVDLHSDKLDRLFHDLYILSQDGAIPVPREVLYEQQGSSRWLHVGYPAELKESTCFRQHFGELPTRGPPNLIIARGRPVLVRSTSGTPHRWWSIVDGVVTPQFWEG